ncbi:elongation factor G [Stackebrandtia nassauensis]|uniref:Small GTP-binding protein n=1 Tax=Stackebrandtia nassauensis (strain DSM 44728 / CIP 108903 / NRRL B-16338 / NBRC 102104 / LLR-40K-21) TaxID=446470 RepID=D3Q0M7_STANL|nr:TetM/TetW/TetO/TetS family tetracycline resistance ribosomal protection protein [Stackebrandtia nassauensis]ADD41763.1 small GTP-binding protein [Stackebrandtia nassauensis DSM 44728]
MSSLNLGIIAHVDAGKTSLTERLLFNAGVIAAAGSVDKGNTQTDTNELERRRGITIQSAVVTFPLPGLTVNLIDTPGHSDFIAEVERALRVLDGVVLVVSAVEGVQAQTRTLMRTIAALGIPTLIFVNKIDRVGAGDAGLLAEISGQLGVRVLAMSTVTDLGSRAAIAHARDLADVDFAAEAAEVLADGDDDFLAAWLAADTKLDAETVETELREQVRRRLVCPVYFGSAVTGTGVEALAEGIRGYLPAVDPVDGEPHGQVFKVERGAGGEKIAYVRMRSGVLRARTRQPVHRPHASDDADAPTQKLTAVRVFDRGNRTSPGEAGSGSIAKVWGLTDVRIGDTIGTPDHRPLPSLFARPTLETVVVPVAARDRLALQSALRDLAERDPLVEPHFDETGRDITINLYGEVQKEVIAATLAEEFGVAVDFDATRTLHIERVTGVGEAVEVMGPDAATHFYATIGLRVEPAEPGSGITYRLEVERGSLLSAMHNAVEEQTRATLGQGLYGWPVLDAVVTMTVSGYAPPVSTPSEFRKLTPIVLMRALAEAGTVVCEPVERFELDVPEDVVAGVLTALAKAGAAVAEQIPKPFGYRLVGTLPTAAVRELELRLPELTHGRGVFASTLDGYRPVTGNPPTRERVDGDPLDVHGYLRYLNNR